MPDNVLDFTQQQNRDRSTTNNVAPAASGVLPGTIPLGKPMQVYKLLPDELAELRKHGWIEGDPIPENMADFLGARVVEAGKLNDVYNEVIQRSDREARDPNYMPPPGPLDTKPIKFTETDISDLPPEDRQRANSIAADVLRAAKESRLLEDEMPPEADVSVLNAIRVASGSTPELQDDTESDTYATGVTKQVSDGPFSFDTDPCSRCGWPKHLKDPCDPTDEDKDNFVAAMLGQKQFEKTYSLFAGRVLLRVRSLMPYEADAIWTQISADYEKERIRTAIDERDFANRYRTCLQVVAIEGFKRPVVLPQTYREWVKSLGTANPPDTPVRVIYESLQDKLAVSESIHRTLSNTVASFNQLQVKLEANSQNPDFWKAIDVS